MYTTKQIYNIIKRGGKIISRAVFNLQNAERARRSQTARTQKQIKIFYEELAQEVHDRIRRLPAGNVSRTQLILLERDIEQRMREISEDISQGIVSSMVTTANIVTEDTQAFLKRMGYKKVDYAKAFLYVPDAVVRNIANGAIYQKGWSLSNAIWGHTKQFNETLSKIIAKGAAQGKGALEIAKDLERFVNPTEARKSRIIESWVYRKDATGNWIYERNKDGTIKTDANGNPIRKRFREVYNPGLVDYNAQRLARTMISHAYQQSFEMVNRNDPFVVGYRWLTSNFHGRVCPICKERAETDHHGLGEGVFPKEDLPLDHPNGMCTFEAVIHEDAETIANQIADWYEAGPGVYPELDRFAADFVYEME